MNYFLHCNEALGMCKLPGGIMKMRLRICVGDWEFDCQSLLSFIIWKLEVKEIESAWMKSKQDRYIIHDATAA